jgi:hypothetical protein
MILTTELYIAMVSFEITKARISGGEEVLRVMQENLNLPLELIWSPNWTAGK